MNLHEIYSVYGECGSHAERAQEVLGQRHWFNELAEFDPRNGRALALDVDTVLRKLRDPQDSQVVKDRLWRIISHCRESILRIISLLNEDPRREQALLPVHAVREMNATSFLALNRRPGRNIREKLSYKPHVQSVRRFQSVDLPENRLFKEFLIQLVDRLELRKRYLGDDVDLITDIRRWLRSDEAQSISRWQNVPANNTLLSHQEYRRIWDAWRWLQDLDDDLGRDFDQVELYSTTISYWNDLAEAYAAGETRFGNIPVLFDYDKFAIEPWFTPIPMVSESVSRREGIPVVDQEVCVDLTAVSPSVATNSSESAVLHEFFVWQRWSKGATIANIEGYRSHFVVQHPDATTVAIPELFFGSKADADLREQAALAFCRRLKVHFGNSELVWLTPDSLSDFELVTIRRNLNAQFARAEPVPRSIAAILENIDYSTIREEGFKVAVVDSSGGTLYSTILTAQFDQELQERLPVTRGFCWVRSPHTVLSHSDGAFDSFETVPRFQTETVESFETTSSSTTGLQGHLTKYEREIGPFDRLVIVDGSPVRGGLRLHQLQKKAGDAPLWRDNMPRLSITVMEDGYHVPLILVDSIPPVRPIRGMEVSIRVEKSLTLPKGRSKYTFPLSIGDDDNDSGFVAELRSSAFPLGEDTDCDLRLTYTYGADDPYRLVFAPKSDQFPPVRALWRQGEFQDVEGSLSNVSPPYPPRKSWEELRRHPGLKPDRRTGSMEKDLLEWIQSALNYLEGAESLREVQERDSKAIDASVKEILDQREWGEIVFLGQDKKASWFLKIDCEFDYNVFCHQSDFVEKFDREKMEEGDTVYLLVKSEEKKGKFVSLSNEVSPELVRAIRNYVSKRNKRSSFDLAVAQEKLFNSRFPSHMIWRDGRSIREVDCPEWFRTAVSNGVERCEELFNLSRGKREDPGWKKLGDEIFSFLCRLQIDAPNFAQRKLAEIADKKEINFPEAQGLACAIGSCSEDWQQQILNRIVAGDSEHKYLILSVAFWKSPEPVHVLDGLQLESLLSDIQHRFRSEIDSLKGAKSSKEKNVKDITKKNIKNIFNILEVLLALLRTRESPDEAIRNVISSSSRFAQLFTKLIDDVPKLEADDIPPSRVEISIEKPDDWSVPDLMYAVRLYLTGDDGASAVRITGITESSKEVEG